MRFLYLISIVLFVAACSHKHDHSEAHDHTTGHDHSASHDHGQMHQGKKCGCADHDKSHNEETCKDCGSKEGCSECKMKGKEADCCKEGKACKKDGKAGAMCTSASSLENNPRILKNISQEDFAKVYSDNKDKLGKSCSAPAMKYCGKSTKDLMITEGELSCLWTKVFRVSRERLPELDGSPCATMIKGFIKK
jgi:hypothetical protein